MYGAEVSVTAWSVDARGQRYASALEVRGDLTDETVAGIEHRLGVAIGKGRAVAINGVACRDTESLWTRLRALSVPDTHRLEQHFDGREVDETTPRTSPTEKTWSVALTQRSRNG